MPTDVAMIEETKSSTKKGTRVRVFLFMARDAGVEACEAAKTSRRTFGHGTHIYDSYLLTAIPVPGCTVCSTSSSQTRVGPQSRGTQFPPPVDV